MWMINLISAVEFLKFSDRNRSDLKNWSDWKSSVKSRWSINQIFNLEFLVTSKSLLVDLSYKSG